MKILHAVGARPNFMKLAPVHRVLAARGADQLVVHTGQHYDTDMSEVFFEELELPDPDVNLGVGSGSHAFQTAEVMKRIETVMQAQNPDLVLVYGDVNSTVASALVASKLRIPVGHVEAGLRSFDRTMPEEINRLITDQMADLLFIHSPEAEENLLREGIERAKIHFVGNVMIDTLVRLLPKAGKRTTVSDLGLIDGAGEVTPYIFTTLHRPSNVDDNRRLHKIFSVLESISAHCSVVFPAHPRTRKQIVELGLPPRVSGIRLLDPLSYLDCLCVQELARAAVTDSGGVQEETTYLGIPCFTLRRNTERPITLTHGTNKLVGDQLDSLHQLVVNCIDQRRVKSDPPKYWDGKAAERIADVISEQYG